MASDSLLGNLLARVAGQTDYEALMLEHIARPLGMDSTRINITPEISSHMATAHSCYSVVTSNWVAPTLAGAGAILSTANDLLTFLAANMGMTGTELQPAPHNWQVPPNARANYSSLILDLAGIYPDPATGCIIMAGTILVTPRSWPGILSARSAWWY